MEHTPSNPSAAVKELEQKAFATIVLALSDSQLVYVRDHVSAASAWTALKNVHARASTGTVLALMRRLYSLKLQPGRSVQQHINSIAECCQQLSAQGKDIAEDDRAFLLLSSLSPEYNPLLAAFETVDKAVLTFHYCCSKLLDEEVHLRAAGIVMETHSSVQARPARGAPSRVSSTDGGGNSWPEAAALDSAVPVCRVRKKKCFLCHQDTHLKKCLPCETEVWRPAERTGRHSAGDRGLYHSEHGLDFRQWGQWALL